MENVYEPPFTAVTLEDLTDSPSLSEEQRGFLDAVRDGCTLDVRSYVQEKHVDVNCVNLSGETALQLAVNNERHDIAKFLLENGAEVGTTLLQAVANGSVDWVKVLLEFVKDREPQGASSSGGSVSLQRSKAQYRKFISPLMLASHNGNQEIVELLLKKGCKIDEPSFHNRSCDCSECESFGKRLGSSLYRLHSYRALASPVFLCMSYLLENSSEDSDEERKIRSSKDPIIRAFFLNRKLESLVETEYEFKNDYKKLSDGCEEFAVSLLAKCRSMEEIACVMSVPGMEQLDYVEVRGGKEAQKLSVLNLAIANQNEKFVAHPYSQLMLNSVLYDKLGGWEDSGFLTKLLLGLLLTVSGPLLALCYFLFPNSRISNFLRRPIVKFTSHTGSFCLFLMLLIFSSVQDKFYNVLQFQVFDGLITLWITGLLFQEAKEANRQGKERYFSQYWNLVTLFMLGMFVISGLFWLAGYFLSAEGKGTSAIPVREAFGIRENESGYRLILLSNAFFSIGLVLSFINASNSFQVNSVLGPLQLSLVKMFRDIAKFLFLFLLLFLAFGWAERKVYSRYVQAKEVFIGNATEHEFAQIGGSLRFLFWDLFGLSELSGLKTDKDFIITQYTGEILLGLYSILSIVVAINMLIAMMANSYQRVADDADIQWKFSRTRMWMPYLDEGNVMPPPFNLIPPPKLVFQLCRRLFADPASCVRGCCVSRDGSASRLRDNVDIRKRCVVMKRLIQRYLLSLEKSRNQSVAPPDKLDERELKDLITRLQDALRRREESKDAADAIKRQKKGENKAQATE